MVVLGPCQRVRVRWLRAVVHPDSAHPLGGVRLLAEHQLQPLDECLPPARPPVVGGGRCGVQRGGAYRLTRRERGATLARQVLQQ